VAGQMDLTNAFGSNPVHIFDRGEPVMQAFLTYKKGHSSGRWPGR
jgi:hypothetical protein